MARELHVNEFRSNLDLQFSVSFSKVICKSKYLFSKEYLFLDVHFIANRAVVIEQAAVCHLYSSCMSPLFQWIKVVVWLCSLKE